MTGSTVFGLCYLIGVFVSWAIYSSRAGLGEIKRSEGVTWHEFLIRNPIFFVLTWFKCLYWLPVLVVWGALSLAGMSRCPWKAATSFEGRAVRKIFRIGYRRAIPELGIQGA
jgi:hypothetical protein